MRYVRIGKWEVHIALIIMALLIISLGTALAITYMTKTYTHTATVNKIGSIELYSNSACTTPLTETYDWDGFNEGQSKTLVFWIKNTGNLANKVRWYAIGFDSYNTDIFMYIVGGNYWVLKLENTAIVKPTNDTSPTVISLNGGQVSAQMNLTLILGTKLASDLSFKVNFIATD